MRVLSVLCGAALMSGCSVFDGMNFDGAKTLDPTKIYLAPSDEVSTLKREGDEYECLSDQPLLCSGRGVGFTCRCPW